MEVDSVSFVTDNFGYLVILHQDSLKINAREIETTKMWTRVIEKNKDPDSLTPETLFNILKGVSVGQHENDDYSVQFCRKDEYLLILTNIKHPLQEVCTKYDFRLDPVNLTTEQLNSRQIERLNGRILNLEDQLKKVVDEFENYKIVVAVDREAMEDKFNKIIENQMDIVKWVKQIELGLREKLETKTDLKIEEIKKLLEERFCICNSSNE